MRKHEKNSECGTFKKTAELLKISMSWEAKQKVREYSRLKRTKGDNVIHESYLDLKTTRNSKAYFA